MTTKSSTPTADLTIRRSWLFGRDGADAVIKAHGTSMLLEGVTVIPGTPKQAARILRKRMRGNRTRRRLRHRLLYPSRRVQVALVVLAFLAGRRSVS